MDSLRLTLLIIGCLFIISIYLWEILYKSEPKKRENILDAVNDIPDMPVYDLENYNIEPDYSAEIADLGNMLSQSHNETFETPINITNLETEPEPEPEFSTGMSVKDFEDKIKPDEDFDVFAAIQEELSSHEVDDGLFDHSVDIEEESENQKIDKGTIEDRSLGNTGNDLLALYITSPAKTLFNGLSISKAADEVGMIYGHMNIFHHFGPGKLHSGQPLFSMANMYEPGSFDLGRMADLRTKGIAIFMYSPASIEPGVVFELFLNTTQRIAKLLGGEVRTADNELLNSAIIQSLRDKAELLSAH